MKVNELAVDQIKIGLKMRSKANYNRIGTIVDISTRYKLLDPNNFWSADRELFIQWDGDDKPYTVVDVLYGGDENHIMCDNEIVED